MTTVLETCGITPPPGAAAELVVPLSFLDLPWLHFKPTHRLVFYNYPCSAAEFSDAIVPKLKHSLSLTLKHYLPVAGNLLYPSNTEKKPLIRYVSGDSAPLTIAVSDGDFDNLIGNHARDADQFYDFMPQMPPFRDEDGYKLVSLIAVQATLFPGRGICIGVSNHHCLGDARSVAGFMWAWAEINKFGGDEEFLSRSGEFLPIFDRSVCGDSGEVDDIFWNAMKKIPLIPPSFPLPTKRVRASFTLHQSDIEKLKNLVLSKTPDLVRVSSFVVAAAYAWICLVKSGDAVEEGEEDTDNKSELFIFPADGRGRPNALVDPPIPVNYFGNCLGGGNVSMNLKDLASDVGFVTAAKAITDEIKKKIYDKHEFMKSAGSWVLNRGKFKEMGIFVVSGSPKFDLTNADFGWGKAAKVEVLSLDGVKYSMSLCNSSDDGGRLVVGMSLPAERMEAFAALFADGLNSYLNMV